MKPMGRKLNSPLGGSHHSSPPWGEGGCAQGEQPGEGALSVVEFDAANVPLIRLLCSHLLPIGEKNRGFYAAAISPKRYDAMLSECVR